MNIKEEMLSYDSQAKNLVDRLLLGFRIAYPDFVAGDADATSFFNKNIGLKNTLANFSIQMIERTASLSDTDKADTLRVVIKINKREADKFRKTLMGDARVKQ